MAERKVLFRLKGARMSGVEQRNEFKQWVSDSGLDIDEWYEGRFHAWAGLSEWPLAVVELPGGSVLAIAHSDVKFPDDG